MALLNEGETSILSEAVAPFVEEFELTKDILPTHDGCGIPYVHMSCDGACTKDKEAGYAYFDGTNFTKGTMPGSHTNNEAEYMGLISLMNHLITTGFDGRAYILMDSEFVVKQMDGSYSVRAENIKPYYQKAKTLESMLDVTIVWISRNHKIMNIVDKLAKEAARCKR